MSHPAMESVLRAINARRAGDGWVGKCPAHDDGHASLSVTERDGKLLWSCKAGCAQDAVRDAFLVRGLEVRTPREDGARQPERVWVIRQPDGTPVAQHVRIDKPDGSKVVFWRGPNGEKAGLREMGLGVVTMPLYGIHDLAAGDVVLTEGEKAADALRGIGVAAVGTVCGASACPADGPLSALQGRTVVLWPDHDDPGRGHMRAVAAKLQALGIKYRTVNWTAARDKGDDAADFVSRGGTKADVRVLLDAKPPLPSGLKRFSEGVAEAHRELDRYHKGDFSHRVSTGLTTLDMRMRGGFAPRQLTLVGAPTGGGKTTLLVQLCMAAVGRGPVLLVSPEMGVSELAEREIQRRSRVEIWERNPWGKHGDAWYEAQREQAREAHSMAEQELLRWDPPLFVWDKPDTSMADVERMAAEIPGLRMIAIDYAQQVAGSDPKLARYLQVGDVAVRSVIMAERHHVPVVVASQVNVSIDKGGKRSYTYRESENLSHKAHNALILDVEWDSDDHEKRKVRDAWVICTKQRNGSAFRAPIYYDPATYRIEDQPRRTGAAAEDVQLQELPRA